MSESSDSGTRGLANGLGLIAAVICAFLGYAHGEWPGAAIAAFVAYGGVHLVFTAISLGVRLAIGGIVLLLILAALKNRWDWLAGLAQ